MLPLLSLAALAHVALRAALGRRRTWPALLLSTAFVSYVHGAHSIFLVAAVYGGYLLAKSLGREPFRAFRRPLRALKTGTLIA